MEDKNKLIALFSNVSSTQEHLLYFLERYPKIINEVNFNGLNFKNFKVRNFEVDLKRHFGELNYSLYLARSSKDKEELRDIFYQGDRSSKISLLQNPHLSLESKMKLFLNLEEGGLTSEDYLYLSIFYFNNFHVRSDSFDLKFKDLVDNESYFLSLESNLKYILREIYIEDFLGNLYIFDFFRKNEVNRHLNSLITEVTRMGFRFEREHFNEIYYSLKRNSSPTFPDLPKELYHLYPALHLPFDSFKHLSFRNGSKSLLPKSFLEYFFFHLDSLNYSSTKIDELISFMTFFEGSFDELLKLDSLL